MIGNSQQLLRFAMTYQEIRSLYLHLLINFSVFGLPPRHLGPWTHPDIKEVRKSWPSLYMTTIVSIPTPAKCSITLNIQSSFRLVPKRIDLRLLSGTCLCPMQIPDFIAKSKTKISIVAI